MSPNNEINQAKEQILYSHEYTKGLKTRNVTFTFFIKSHTSIFFIVFSFFVSTITFIILRHFFHTANLYHDSLAYLQNAQLNSSVSFRPIAYSKIISFFKAISDSDISIILAQFYANYFANIFLFLTTLYFFPVRKIGQWLLFILLFLNPLYFSCSNYILSDAFFCSLIVIWFCLLLWSIVLPKWYFFALQIAVLVPAFYLRYHGIIFPIISLVCIVWFSNVSLIKKAVVAFINIACFVFIIIITTNNNKRTVGINAFSAFSGWQIANNAMFIVENNPSCIDGILESDKDSDLIEAANFIKHYYDTSLQPLKETVPSGIFIWDTKSPLRSYHKFYVISHHLTDAQGEQVLGPVFKKFGTSVIKRNPYRYLKNFILPNFKLYLKSRMEALAMYNLDADKIPAIAAGYYKYENTTVPALPRHRFKLLTSPFRYVFFLSNALFIAISIAYFKILGYEKESLFTKIILTFSTIFFINLIFVTVLVPSAFRYQIFIQTLLFPYLIAVTEQILLKKFTKNATTMAMPSL